MPHDAEPICRLSLLPRVPFCPVSLTAGCIFTVFLSLAGQAARSLLLRLIHPPDQAAGPARTYLTIIFPGFANSFEGHGRMLIPVIGATGHITLRGVLVDIMVLGISCEEALPVPEGLTHNSGCPGPCCPRSSTGSIPEPFPRPPACGVVHWRPGWIPIW